MSANRMGWWTLLLSLGLAGHMTARAGDATQNPIALAGEWRFALDRQDQGTAENWHRRSLEQRIQLPGALQNQGFGDDITPATKWTANVNDRSWWTEPAYEPYRQPGNIKVPFWLQPRKHYVGAAWYQRDLEIPEQWQGRRIVLTLERPHWTTRVWLDDREAGRQDSLSTAHVYDLGTNVKPGQHTLTIRVDNRLAVDVGIWAHSVSDHTQGNWNGVVGRIELTSTAPVWIDDAQVFPNSSHKTAQVKVKLGNTTGQPGSGHLLMGNQRLPVTWDARGGMIETELTFDQTTPLWDEFTPVLQKITIQLEGDQARDERTVTFGLREIGVEDKQFVINGRKTFFRGTLECCIFPLTGYPPTDVESWRRIIRVCKDHGLNHIRFHSWCPPEAAFVAADEMGFYYQVECAAWTTVGDGAPIDQWLYAEGERITRAYGNHPSFVLMPYGNEPGGAKQNQYLAQWVKYWAGRDPRRLYTSGSGWPSIPENQYHVTPAPRGRNGWIGKDYRDAIKNLAAPVIVHEMAQWCVYPNFDEISKYTGLLEAKNFEIFRDFLDQHGMLDQWRDFLRASGRLQALCYKEEIEAAFRTPGVSGVQLLDLHDFPGQGTALVGVLDAFWDQKGYITPGEFRRFYNTTVPLTRMAKRVWTTDETFQADAEVAHFGAQPLEHASTYWKLVDDGQRIVKSGVWQPKTLPIGTGTSLGRVQIDLASLPSPRQYKLLVGIQGTPFENDWNIWVYPATRDVEAPADILVATAFDEAVITKLNAGGKVLLCPSKLSGLHLKGSFTPVFWNRQWFPSQACQTLGLLCDPRHPALADFPTSYHSDWQWEDLTLRSRNLVLDELPRALRPVVQVIDDWNTNRKLGLVFECRVGAGKLLVCAAEITKDLTKRPAARQLRSSLLRYMNEPAFNPTVDVPPETLTRLLQWASPSTLLNLEATIVKTDSEDRANGNVAANAIDGNPDTIWHTEWAAAKPAFPHELVIDMGRELELAGFRLLPRQEMENGWFTQYEFYVSAGVESWGAPAAKGSLAADAREKTVRFATPQHGRFLRLVALRGVHNQPFAAVAELDVIPVQPLK